MNRIDYRVYLVTDEPSRYRGNWLDNIVAAVKGGVTCVQYRDSENEPRVQYERIMSLRDAVGNAVPIIVNNDADLALATKAEGVHVGQSDMRPDAVRKIVGEDCEIGYSITNESQLADARSLFPQALDAIGIGPVFDARKTKANAADALGLERLAKIVELSAPIPNCAIGGITLENAAGVIAAGAKGLAVVSAFSKSSNPYETAKNFKMLFDHCRL